MPQKILVVDDEKDIVELLRYNLSQAGFEVREASDGRSALEAAKSRNPDLIILDVMLPDLSGTEVCRILRKDERTRTTPILMLTVKSEEAEKVAAFELGADDYVTKPFSPREVVLRVRAILRRLDPEVEAKVYQVGKLLVDVPGHKVAVRDQRVELTATEFKLLTYLLQHRGQVVERETLLDKVWGLDADIFTRTVDTHVTRLRQKLGEYGPHVEAVRGVGYRFSDRE